VISGFRREVDDNCALLGYYVASSGDSLSTFRRHIPFKVMQTSYKNFHNALNANTNAGFNESWTYRKLLCPKSTKLKCLKLPLNDNSSFSRQHLFCLKMVCLNVFDFVFIGYNCA